MSKEELEERVTELEEILEQFRNVIDSALPTDNDEIDDDDEELIEEE